MADEVKALDVDGYEIVTDALVELLNDFPKLQGDEILFATLDENRGKAMFPLNGAVIERTSIDITGWVEQTCSYPFLVIYRTGHLTEERRTAVKEWLDTLGRWLEKQTIDGERLTEYPKLSDDRRFTTIRRTSPSYLNATADNGTEDWAISITASYINQFQR